MSDLIEVAKNVNRTLKNVVDSIDRNNRLVEQILEANESGRKDILDFWDKRDSAKTDKPIIDKSIELKENSSLVEGVQPMSLIRLLDLVKHRDHGQFCACDLCCLWKNDFATKHRKGITITEVE